MKIIPRVIQNERPCAFQSNRIFYSEIITSWTQMSDALIGFIGVIVGSAATLISQYFAHWLQTRDAKARDLKRRALLTHLLDNPGTTGWRSMATLSGVIGASREETARLLIDMDARRNEAPNGSDVWGWIKDHPLPDAKDET